ncbi:MAG: MarR family transcriptional regulator [Myxococcota bacterium]
MSADEPLEVALFGRLIRLAQQIRHRADAEMADQDINPAQFFILGLLQRRGPLAQRDIAAAMRTSASNVSQLLRKMEASGLVERGSRSATRRTELTDAGRAAHGRLKPQHDAFIKTQFAGLSEAEQRLMLVWFDRLLA